MTLDELITTTGPGVGGVEERRLKDAALEKLNDVDATTGLMGVVSAVDAMVENRQDADLVISLWAETLPAAKLRQYYDQALADPELEDIFDIFDLTATTSVAFEEAMDAHHPRPFIEAFAGTEIMG